ncbi:MAG: DUF885 domain-containing protein [Gemmatimonadaceae bacterium]|nr:DUF885 domain-containing protein [Gemmatimonadaceae bacterium]
MTNSRLAFQLAAALVLLQGGAAVAQSPDSTRSGFPALANEFVFTSLAFSPAYATQAGLHDWTDPYTGRRAHLDSLLDSFTPHAIARQRGYFMRVQSRLGAIDRAHLDAQTQADYDVVANAAAFALFSLTKERFHEYKPQMYAEDLGNSLFANISLEYADRNTRAADLTARVARVPAFLDVARRNLRATNDVYTRVALEETDGVTALVKDMGAGFVRGTPSQARYARVAPAAIAALTRFQRFVKDTLPQRGTVDWRSGVGLFNAKWKYSLAVSLTPDEALRIAEDSMQKTRAEMLVLARPLHDKWFPPHKHGGDSTAVLNAIVSETLARIGAEHASRDSLLQQAKSDVGALTRVVRDQRVVSLDSFPNLQVIPTPEFMRGVYGVAGAVFAPPLNPNLATFYWVTPIPAAWTSERADSKLREYNTYKMLDLTMHEGIPGHVVQGAYSNLLTPDWRRLLRSVYSNTPYVEGWAVYAEHVMMYDAHVDGGDPVKMKLTDLKGMLRIYTNVIIDIRLHTRSMPGDSAVAFMMRDAFQERPEAEAKLQRAQLDYVQLNAYFAGVEEWTRLRQDAEKREGKDFNLCRYHDRVLLYGALPVPVIRRLYMAGVAPTSKALPSRCATTSAANGR